MNSTGTALIYSTYFGGSNRESGNDIALDSAGNAYVTGLTDSPNIPTTPGAFRSTPVGSDEFDVFAMKLNATGTALVYSTYLGGLDYDEGPVYQMQRLERCRRDLLDPAHAARHISDIAFAWGFNDLAHFSRIFKQRFGASPREWREHPTP